MIIVTYSDIWLFMKQAISIIGVFLLLQSCKVGQQQKTLSDNLVSKTGEITLYLIFEVFKTNDDQFDVEFVKAHRLDPKTAIPYQEASVEEKQLLFELLDENGQLVQETLFDNPLYKSYESYAESGAIERLQGQQDRAKIVMGMSVRDHVAFVKVTDTEGFERTFEL